MTKSMTTWRTDWNELLPKLSIKRGETPKEIDTYTYYYVGKMLNECID